MISYDRSQGQVVQTLSKDIFRSLTPVPLSIRAADLVILKQQFSILFSILIAILTNNQIWAAEWKLEMGVGPLMWDLQFKSRLFSALLLKIKIVTVFSPMKKRILKQYVEGAFWGR